MPLAYAFILALLFLAFFALEFLLPSGGILGVIAAVCLFSAIAVAFTHSATAGFSFVLGSLVLTPLMFTIMIRLWPKTFFGRRILNDPSASRERDKTIDQESRTNEDSLIGRVGIAATDMLPSGLIKIENKRYDAVSTGVAIDRGAAVEVVRVMGRIIHVRPTEKKPVKGPEKKTESETPTLETPVESLGIDDMSDPLG